MHLRCHGDSDFECEKNEITTTRFLTIWLCEKMIIHGAENEKNTRGNELFNSK